MERPQHRALGAAAPLVHRLDQHGDTQHVGEEDEFLTGGITFLADGGEVFHGVLPLLDRGAQLTDVTVQMADETLEQLTQPGVRGVAEAVDGRGGDGCRGFVGAGHDIPPVVAGVRRPVFGRSSSRRAARAAPGEQAGRNASSRAASVRRPRPAAVGAALWACRRPSQKAPAGSRSAHGPAALRAPPPLGRHGGHRVGRAVGPHRPGPVLRLVSPALRRRALRDTGRVRRPGPRGSGGTSGTAADVCRPSGCRGSCAHPRAGALLSPLPGLGVVAGGAVKGPGIPRFRPRPGRGPRPASSRP